MLSNEEFAQRRCVRELIDVVGQVPFRAAARGIESFDRDLAATLLLWTALRWERGFALRTIETLCDDSGALTRDLDARLAAECPANGPRFIARNRTAEIERSDACRDAVRAWLDAAADEARVLGHDFLGVEHLVLAILRHEDSPARDVLSHHGVTHRRLEEAVTSAIASSAVAVVAELVEPTADPTASAGEAAGEAAVSWAARWDKRAIGVPRRFGVSVLMLLVTMYAVLFSAMQVLGAHPGVFLSVAVFFTIVGLAQILMFEGQFPRAASIWAGAIALPLECVVAVAVLSYLYTPPPIHLIGILGAVFALVVAMPFGAFFGYLAGGLTAGIFVLIDRYAARQKPLDEDASPPELPS